MVVVEAPALVVAAVVVVVAVVVEAAMEVVEEMMEVVVEAVVGLDGSLLGGLASTASFLRVSTGTGGGRMMEGVA